MEPEGILPRRVWYASTRAWGVAATAVAALFRVLVHPGLDALQKDVIVKESWPGVVIAAISVTVLTTHVKGGAALVGQGEFGLKAVAVGFGRNNAHNIRSNLAGKGRGCVSRMKRFVVFQIDIGVDDQHRWTIASPGRCCIIHNRFHFRIVLNYSVVVVVVVVGCGYLLLRRGGSGWRHRRRRG